MNLPILITYYELKVNVIIHIIPACHPTSNGKCLFIRDTAPMGSPNARIYCPSLGGVMAEIWDAVMHDEVKALQQSKYEYKSIFTLAICN